MTPAPIDFDDKNGFGTQMVVSDEAATCALRAVAHSNLGRMKLNSGKIDEMFGISYKFDSQNIAKHIGLFNEKFNF